jgi:hypothetical protein
LLRGEHVRDELVEIHKIVTVLVDLTEEKPELFGGQPRIPLAQQLCQFAEIERTVTIFVELIKLAPQVKDLHRSCRRSMAAGIGAAI